MPIDKSQYAEYDLWIIPIYTLNIENNNPYVKAFRMLTNLNPQTYFYLNWGLFRILRGR